MKKLYLLLGAALFSGSMMAAALDTIQVNGVYYQLNEETQTAAVIRKDSKFVYEQESVVIPVSVNKDEKAYDVVAVEKSAFAKATCKSITFAEGSKVTMLGMMAFQNATNLEEFIVPEGVKYLPMTCFHCTNNTMKLHKITLPSTLDSLDAMSIVLMNLDTIICNATKAPRCNMKPKQYGSPFFVNKNKAFVPKSAKVIVPAGSEMLYRAEQGWNHFDCLHDEATIDTLRIGNLYYTIKDNKATIAPNLASATYTMSSVVIPSTITAVNGVVGDDGKMMAVAAEIPVIMLGRKAFFNATSITSLTFAEPSNIDTIGMQAMQYMAGLTGTLELPEGLKFIAMSGIHSGLNGGQMPVKKLVLPSTLDSLDVISVVLNELDTLEFKGETAPKCRVRVTTTQTQIPWMINPNNNFPTPKNVQIIIPDGSYDSYKNQAGLGDYFDYFTSPSTDTENVKDAAANPAKTGIYNIMGTYLGTDDSNLPTGMYIINGKKVIR